MDRREFLKLGLAGAAGAAGVAAAPALAGHLRSGGRRESAGSSGSTASGGTKPAAATTPPGMAVGRPKHPRTLVLIELAGGNDGINTLVPLDDGRYHDLRPSTGLERADLHPLGKSFGLHPSLARLSKRGVAGVAGVGTAKPDGSHFEMMHRWWTGDSDGSHAPSTGFLGRLSDVVGDADAAAVAVGLGSGPSPALVSARVSTVSLPNLSLVDLFARKPDDRMLTAFQRGIESMASGRSRGAGQFAAAGAGMQRAIGTARLLAGDGLSSDDSLEIGGGDLGTSLGQAVRLLQADVGVRVVHVVHDGFDTHSGHKDQHAQRLAEVDEAVDGFLAALDRRGLGGSTLVATTSEFGRRVADNGSDGLDHGAASVALMFGPVHAGVHGEYPSLSKLDDNGNLVATVDMSTYYATLAAWLGVGASDVLPSKAKALNGVLKT